MKKLKSILCITFAFILTAIVLCACGTNNNKENQVGTKTTISLAEAKELIVSALAINNNQLQTQSTRGPVLHAADVSEPNRDILEKLGNFTFDERNYDNEVDEPMNENHSFSGQATYNDYNFRTALIKDVNGQEIYYSSSNDKSLHLTGDVVTIEDGFGVASNFIIYQSLFADEAFNSIYDDTATKEINKDGYSITLTGDLSYFLGSSFEEYDTNYFNVTVNVDGNNDVISAVVSFQFKYKETIEGTTTQNRITTSTMTFTKTNTPITEPEWVASYRQTNGIA